MLFLIALVALVAYQLQRDIRLVRRLHPSPPWRSPVHRAGLIFVLLFTVPFLFVRYSNWGGALTLSSTTALFAYGFLSFLISYTWYRYLTWLDRFEPERTAWILVVFLLSCGTTFLVFPLGSLIIPNLGLVMDGTAYHDWWYAVIGIGLVEETVKLLPLLVILLFTRQADEPFDLILYASISALGFAFIENMQYLASSEFHAIGGRVLYASVAHMVFSSNVAYSIAMTRRAGWPWAVGLFGGLVLASFAHGFYDFWLLAPDRPGVLTLMFFLANIHLWVMMKNNLINLSPHYQESMRPQPVMFRYRMINALSAIFLFTYILKFLIDGEIAARDLLLAQGPTMGATLLFLAISLSSFRFIPGYVAPLRPTNGIWGWLFPRIEWGEDLTGRRLQLRIPEQRSDTPHYMALHRALPLEGTLGQRVILEGDRDWYLFRLERPIPFDGAYGGALLIQPHRDNDTIPDDRYVLVAAMTFNGTPELRDGKAHKRQLAFTGFVHGRLV
ncbi:MAG: PrsW family intramembrane metalloprotease [Flavobacteriales bacterium]|nr:PrsW family intramembrane metalloprotease [Flavobacteriales bacterium]